MTAEQGVEQILDLYRQRGGERYGERVTQLDHALQCATLAALSGASDCLVAAALLHDYGHLIDNRGRLAEAESVDDRHEAVGADALRAWFGAAVTQPIALHVAAKRYLCAAEPGYLEQLSAASQQSLALQGGPFDAAAAAAFRAAPGASAAIALRRWDDRAKVAGLATPDLAHFCGYVAASIAGPGGRGSADRAPAARSSAG